MATYTTRAQLRRVKAWAEVVDRIESETSDPSHYFDRDTVKYFSNQWHGLPVGAPYSTDLYFVESRAFEADAREFLVKKVSTSGVVWTVGTYTTASVALAAAQFLAGRS